METTVVSAGTSWLATTLKPELTAKRDYASISSPRRTRQDNVVVEHTSFEPDAWMDFCAVFQQPSSERSDILELA